MMPRVPRSLVGFIDRITRLPGIRQALAHRFERRFARSEAIGMCRGIYDHFDQAAAAAPQTRPLGYDHEAATTMYRDRMQQIFPSDYPMLHWLRRAFDQGVLDVFDLGGHIGLSYYAYRRYLEYPAGLRWQVSDVPAVNRAGTELARALDRHGALSFTDDFSRAGSAHLLFTSGCLQYLQETLAERLASLGTRPEWVLVNLLPLHEQAAYWTVQSIGTAFCPYRIQQRDAFLSEMRAIGYDVLDEWENPEKRCIIAYEPAFSLDGYRGMAFRRQPTH